jgi:hypothetical protein
MTVHDGRRPSFVEVRMDEVDELLIGPRPGAPPLTDFRPADGDTPDAAVFSPVDDAIGAGKAFTSPLEPAPGWWR